MAVNGLLVMGPPGVNPCKEGEVIIHQILTQAFYSEGAWEQGPWQHRTYSSCPQGLVNRHVCDCRTSKIVEKIGAHTGEAVTDSELGRRETVRAPFYLLSGHY